MKRDRGPILVTPCPGIPLPPDALMELEVAIYGLDDAPFRWRQTLVKFLEGIGMQRALLDACWWVLRDTTGRPIQMALLDVDDLILAAPKETLPGFQKAVQTRFKVGKLEQEESEFCGRHIKLVHPREHEPAMILVDMEKYIEEKVQEIPMTKTRKAQKSELLSQSEFEELRSLVFKFAWLSRKSRPELSGTSSLMASRLRSATVQDLVDCNHLVAYLKATSKRALRLHAIPTDKMHFITFSDAGGTLGKESGMLDEEGQARDTTQGAWLIFAADQPPQPRIPIRLAPLMWKSAKLKRKVPSTLAGETLALGESIATLEWLQAVWSDVIFNAVHRADWRDKLQQYTLGVGLKSELCKRGCSTTHVIDAKALFDALQKEASSSHQDRRAAVDLSIIPESVSRAQAQLRWVPHGQMLADPLTKIRADLASPALEQTLASGWYRFVSEEDELAERAMDKRAKYRSRGATVKRLANVPSEAEEAESPGD
eukprot:5738574-Amphidinium_carterae.1